MKRARLAAELARAATLALLCALASCPASEAKSDELAAQASAALHENDPARALSLYERALERAPRGSESWHRARWQRLHALAGADPAAVAPELERVLREDSRRIAPLEVQALAFKLCLAGREEGLEVFERGMDHFGLAPDERATWVDGLRQALESARASAAAAPR